MPENKTKVCSDEERKMIEQCKKNLKETEELLIKDINELNKKHKKCNKE